MRASVNVWLCAVRLHVCREVRAAGCDVWQVVLWLTRLLCCSVTYLYLSVPAPLAERRLPDLPCAPQLIGPTACVSGELGPICLDTPAL